MRIRLLLANSLFVLLAGCSSEPVVISYYMLASPVPRAEFVREVSDKPSMVIEDVDLAAYLQQPGMIVQSGNNQIVVSRRHLWAEGLDEAVPKVLFRELQRQSRDYVYYLKFLDFVPRSDYRLRLHIDNLQATDQGEVIAAGRYQLIADKPPFVSVTADFYFTRDLQEDGFDHSVEQIRILIGEIAGAVLGSLGNLNEQLDV